MNDEKAKKLQAAYKAELAKLLADDEWIIENVKRDLHERAAMMHLDGVTYRSDTQTFTIEIKRAKTIEWKVESPQPNWGDRRKDAD